MEYGKIYTVVNIKEVTVSNKSGINISFDTGDLDIDLSNVAEDIMNEIADTDFNTFIDTGFDILLEVEEKAGDPVSYEAVKVIEIDGRDAFR